MCSHCEQHQFLDCYYLCCHLHTRPAAFSDASSSNARTDDTADAHEHQSLSAGTEQAAFANKELRELTKGYPCVTRAAEMALKDPDLLELKARAVKRKLDMLKKVTPLTRHRDATDTLLSKCCNLHCSHLVGVASRGWKNGRCCFCLSRCCTIYRRHPISCEPFRACIDFWHRLTQLFPCSLRCSVRACFQRGHPPRLPRSSTHSLALSHSLAMQQE